MRRLVSVCFTATILLVAGCGSKHLHPTVKRYHVVAHADTRWKKVINDWYDGGIDHRHSCTSVQEAIGQLPFDAYTGTARGDLKAYARKVC